MRKGPGDEAKSGLRRDGLFGPIATTLCLNAFNGGRLGPSTQLWRGSMVYVGSACR
jgi:hypothetical protein